MSEKNMWRNLRKKMVPVFWLEATRHEDTASRGVADVSFVQRELIATYDRGVMHGHGWMELKYRSAKPVRAATIVRLDHYTDEQRMWLMAKGEAGMTFLLLQLERDYLLFNHEQAQAVGTLNTADLYAHANWVSRGKLDAEELAEAIGMEG